MMKTLEDKKQEKIYKVKMATVNAIASNQLNELGIDHKIDGIYIYANLKEGTLKLLVQPEDDYDTIRKNISSLLTFWDNWRNQDWSYIILDGDLIKMFRSHMITDLCIDI